MIIYHDTNAVVLGMTQSTPHTIYLSTEFLKGERGGGRGRWGRGKGDVQFFSWNKLPMQSFSSDADQEECQKMETALSCVKVRNALGY